MGCSVEASPVDRESVHRVEKVELRHVADIRSARHRASLGPPITDTQSRQKRMILLSMVLPFFLGWRHLCLGRGKKV